MDNLTTRSKELRKQYFNSYFLLGLFFCLFAIICFAIDILIEGLGIMLVILVLIPLFFGTLMQAFTLPLEQKLEIKQYFQISYSYYKPEYYGCFHLIKSFLKTLLIEVVASIIVGMITQSIFINMYGDKFLEPLECIVAFVTSGNNDLELLEEIFLMNDGILENYANLLSGIVGLFGAIGFIYFVSFNSISCYFRAIMPNKNYNFNRNAVEITLNNHRVEIFKDFWALNWPMFLILTVGFTAGAMLSIFAFKSFIYIIIAGLMVGFLALIPYFPFFLSNMQAIFDKYKLSLSEGITGVIKEYAQKIENMVEVSDEDKEKIENALKEIEEENKKDPDSGS